MSDPPDPNLQKSPNNDENSSSNAPKHSKDSVDPAKKIELIIAKELHAEKKQEMEKELKHHEVHKVLKTRKIQKNEEKEKIEKKLRILKKINNIEHHPNDDKSLETKEIVMEDYEDEDIQNLNTSKGGNEKPLKKVALNTRDLEQIYRNIQLLHEDNQELREECQELRKTNEQLVGLYKTVRAELDTIKNIDRTESVKKATIEKIKADTKETKEAIKDIHKSTETLVELAKEDWEQQKKFALKKVHSEALEVKSNVKEISSRVDKIEYRVGTISTKADLATKEVSYAKKEIKSAVRKVDTLPFALPGNDQTKTPANLKEIMKAQKELREKQSKIKKDEFRVYIRLPDNNKKTDRSNVGDQINKVLSKKAVKEVNFTHKGHLVVKVKEKETAENANEWINKIDPAYTILDTETWYKAVLEDVPLSVTMDEVKEALYDYEDYNIVLNNEPKKIGERDDHQSVLVSFKNAQDYSKCLEDLVIRYVKVRVRPFVYRKRTHIDFDRLRNNILGNKDKEDFHPKILQREKATEKNDQDKTKVPEPKEQEKNDENQTSKENQTEQSNNNINNDL